MRTTRVNSVMASSIPITETHCLSSHDDQNRHVYKALRLGNDHPRVLIEGLRSDFFKAQLGLFVVASL